MLDYKPTRKRAGVKPLRRGKSKDKLSSRPLRSAVVNPGAERPVSKRSDAEPIRPAAFALTGAKALCVLLAGWLVLGLGVETVGLWNSPLGRVEISGNSTVEAEELVAAAGFGSGQPLGEIDPFAAAARLSAHPKLSSADVRRIFPGLLIVAVQEREPAALVHVSERMRAVIDETGRILALVEAAQSGQWQALPRIVFDVSRPVAGGNLTGAGFTRALRLLSLIGVLGLDEGEAFSINANRSSGLELDLPERNHRVILPYSGMERALRLYPEFAAVLPQGSVTRKIIDLRAINPAYGGRAILSP